ncbi:MAG: tRNA pseudouridine(55) synthase TruB [Ruminococcaceae bacterium]|nr:tRNA pseudouridine(55) synthase TruB [Oscillospiraceae bacterium]
MNGVIVVNKPEDFTSFDVVAVMRKICNERKIGHCGTLDPNATGVLPVLLGRAAKAQDILPNHDKTYIAEFVLGKVTDTLDVWGEVQREEKTSIKKEKLLSVLPDFTGEIEQIPPMFSAVQINGQRLYDLARKGIEVERKPRKITVYSLELLDFDEETQRGKLKVACSKGTYIRTLIDDIAKRFCMGGCMTSLVRSEACGFSIDKAYTLDELRALSEKCEIEKALLSIESLFVRYEEIFLSDAQSKRFANGGALDVNRIRKKPETLADGGIYRIKSQNNTFMGLGIYKAETSEIKVYKQFADYSEFN